MRKIFSFLLAALLVWALSGCSNNPPNLLPTSPPDVTESLSAYPTGDATPDITPMTTGDQTPLPSPSASLPLVTSKR